MHIHFTRQRGRVQNIAFAMYWCLSTCSVMSQFLTVCRLMLTADTLEPPEPDGLFAYS
uniref:Uncharacterized protein n=1 Tax=Anguilla anguilla TaxID=7936 RepID=A0A0E9T7C4_ANGAN